jgi:sucrose phosphorylase
MPALYIHSLLATTNDLDLVEQTGRTRSINRGHWQQDELQARLADPDSPQARMLEHCKRVMACREAQPALRPDSEQAVSPGPPGVFLLRRSCPEQSLVIAASVMETPQEVPLHGTGLPAGRFHDCLTGQWVNVGETLALEPYEVLWLDVTNAIADAASSSS